MIKAFSSSLSLRLLGIFIATAIATICILIWLFTSGLHGQWRRSIFPHLVQYVQYVQQDLGSPPRPERAEAIAQRLPVEIHIYKGNKFLYSTTPTPLNLNKLSFRTVAQRSNIKTGRHDLNSNLTTSIAGKGSSPDRILRIEENGYTVYYDLNRHTAGIGQRRNRDDSGIELWVALAALFLVLGGSYLLIRRQLSPIRQIQTSVGRMSNAELNHRIQRIGNSDLDVLAQSIDSMAERLQAMLDAKRQLLVAISHELRSPLTRARISAELLPESVNRQRLLDDLMDMQRMITDIMESEQLQGNHSVLNLESLDVALLFRDELGRLAPETQLQVSNPNQPVMLQGDAARLRILLRNLVANALHHGQSDQGKTDLTVKLLSLENHAQLHVIDLGKGIDQQHLPGIADPLFRPDPSRSRETGGFGMGLTLARLIAEAHGGNLHIDSNPSVQPGTRAVVNLPLSQSQG